jgi:hypothetical protein
VPLPAEYVAISGGINSAETIPATSPASSYGIHLLDLIHWNSFIGTHLLKLIIGTQYASNSFEELDYYMPSSLGTEAETSKRRPTTPQS